jgi:hypothetical protein
LKVNQYNFVYLSLRRVFKAELEASRTGERREQADFSHSTNASLSLIIDSSSLFSSGLYQKTHFFVNNRGENQLSYTRGKAAAAAAAAANTRE